MPFGMRLHFRFVRWLAVLLAVMPWAGVLLSVPEQTEPGAAWSSHHNPFTPQYSSDGSTPNAPFSSSEVAVPPSLQALALRRTDHDVRPRCSDAAVASSQKLFLSYSRLQLDGG